MYNTKYSNCTLNINESNFPATGVAEELQENNSTEQVTSVAE